MSDKPVKVTGSNSSKKFFENDYLMVKSNQIYLGWFSFFAAAAAFEFIRLFDQKSIPMMNY